ncbi:uncharacterized protein LTR77_010812 [Saxophila tyrrhenica]|uniref:Uncharacterized protein n=1 Tax=Saxophila tyrrhenica TaxID=1690608 RepID=A0AAV9NY86_9PEZI|nr:hypothetical protein LTR77_010812 [Saxophila tyrrhenica]
MAKEMARQFLEAPSTTIQVMRAQDVMELLLCAKCQGKKTEKQKLKEVWEAELNAKFHPVGYHSPYVNTKDANSANISQSLPAYATPMLAIACKPAQAAGLSPDELATGTVYMTVISFADGTTPVVVGWTKEPELTNQQFTHWHNQTVGNHAKHTIDHVAQWQVTYLDRSIIRELEASRRHMGNQGFRDCVYFDTSFETVMEVICRWWNFLEDYRLQAEAAKEAQACLSQQAMSK